MNQKELTKTFMMVSKSNCKNSFLWFPLIVQKQFSTLWVKLHNAHDAGWIHFWESWQIRRCTPHSKDKMLTQCCFNFEPNKVGPRTERVKTWYMVETLNQCWADVEDGGPTLKQHWFNVSCLLGYLLESRLFLFFLEYYTAKSVFHSL